MTTRILHVLNNEIIFNDNPCVITNNTAVYFDDDDGHVDDDESEFTLTCWWSFLTGVNVLCKYRSGHTIRVNCLTQKSHTGSVEIIVDSIKEFCLQKTRHITTCIFKNSINSPPGRVDITDIPGWQLLGDFTKRETSEGYDVVSTKFHGESVLFSVKGTTIDPNCYLFSKMPMDTRLINVSDAVVGDAVVGDSNFESSCFTFTKEVTIIPHSLTDAYDLIRPNVSQPAVSAKPVTPRTPPRSTLEILKDGYVDVILSIQKMTHTDVHDEYPKEVITDVWLVYNSGPEKILIEFHPSVGYEVHIFYDGVLITEINKGCIKTSAFGTAYGICDSVREELTVLTKMYYEKNIFTILKMLKEMIHDDESDMNGTRYTCGFDWMSWVDWMIQFSTDSRSHRSFKVFWKHDTIPWFIIDEDGITFGSVVSFRINVHDIFGLVEQVASSVVQKSLALDVLTFIEKNITSKKRSSGFFDGAEVKINDREAIVHFDGRFIHIDASGVIVRPDIPEPLETSFYNMIDKTLSRWSMKTGECIVCMRKGGISTKCCGHYIHARCFTQWKTQCDQNDIPVSCPYCRNNSPI